ncbi:hypothetical protein DFA_00443 [Cavenderia fasciculata]|uniref:Gamete and mating-type specific protein A n=1 Tax=Cavenderia fasciculata TaxID=261658 RepID=F4PRT3_CACFS|nr:uncharacterized protein DFA_00443 [Cavenderia fasciculata]EGG20582.1 hypothetical protein DFA_00443 [Cavenderia fasciculata]|eukprot:XP_004358432.1 hypothetical protein DFA_00443 [Cavenderia fasciculata]
MKLLFIGLSVLFISSFVNCEGPLTSQEIQTLITYHNNWRLSPDPASAGPLTALTYNYDIAATLQAHVNKCDFTFSPATRYGAVNEWIYWWTPQYFNMESQMNLLWGQRLNYDWNTGACLPDKSCLPWVFTVWNATTNFGCAKVDCGERLIMACDYNPPGGYSGVKPYQLAPVTPTPAPTPSPTPVPPTSNNIDWRPFLTPIRHQGQCGSCWTFGSVAAIESRYLIKNGLAEINTLDLSEQNGVNCLRFGCNGGWSQLFFETFMEKGLAYEKDMPYLAADQPTCSYDIGTPRFRFSSYGTVPRFNKQAMIDELRNGPITVSLWVDDAFQSYSGGIFNCQTVYTTTNHIVTLIGYNADQDYWILRNSWGKYWGTGGGNMLLTAANDNCYMLGYSSYYPII